MVNLLRREKTGLLTIDITGQPAGRGKGGLWKEKQFIGIRRGTFEVVFVKLGTQQPSEGKGGGEEDFANHHGYMGKWGPFPP